MEKAACTLLIQDYTTVDEEITDEEPMKKWVSTNEVRENTERLNCPNQVRQMLMQMQIKAPQTKWI